MLATLARPGCPAHSHAGVAAVGPGGIADNPPACEDYAHT
jgi:hypothetical protein